MGTILIISIALVLLILLAIYSYHEGKRRGTKMSSEFTGICMTALDRTVRKQANLDKVMDLFTSKPELSNHDIREALGVSSRTAVRYMDQLEAEGRVVQTAKTGHFTTYRQK